MGDSLTVTDYSTTFMFLLIMVHGVCDVISFAQKNRPAMGWGQHKAISWGCSKSIAVCHGGECLH